MVTVMDFIDLLSIANKAWFFGFISVATMQIYLVYSQNIWLRISGLYFLMLKVAVTAKKY